MATSSGKTPKAWIQPWESTYFRTAGVVGAATDVVELAVHAPNLA
jgi:hypothetical protein